MAASPQGHMCLLGTAAGQEGEGAAMTLSFPIYFSSLPLPCIRWQMKRTWLINNTPGEFLSHRELLADLAGLSCVGGPSSLYWPANAPGPHSRGATDEGSQRKNAWGLASGRKTGERTNEYDRQTEWFPVHIASSSSEQTHRPALIPMRCI